MLVVSLIINVKYKNMIKFGRLFNSHQKYFEIFDKEYEITKEGVEIEY